MHNVLYYHTRQIQKVDEVKPLQLHTKQRWLKHTTCTAYNGLPQFYSNHWHTHLNHISLTLLKRNARPVAPVNRVEISSDRFVRDVSQVPHENSLDPPMCSKNVLPIITPWVSNL